jgi:hypothetical protein
MPTRLVLQRLPPTREILILRLQRSPARCADSLAADASCRCSQCLATAVWAKLQMEARFLCSAVKANDSKPRNYKSNATTLDEYFNSRIDPVAAHRHTVCSDVNVQYCALFPAIRLLRTSLTLSQPSKTQILVIGGGPAGSYSAAVLAREGFSVVVLEIAKFPRSVREACTYPIRQSHVGSHQIPYRREHASVRETILAAHRC